MLYSDLLNLSRDRGDRISLDDLQSLGLNMPYDVLEQFCSDHAAKNEFQEQYGHLNLSSIEWDLREVKARDIVLVSIYPSFQNWTNNVELRLKHFDAESWNCIDSRTAVIAHWSMKHTWLRPPVILDGMLLGLPGQMHLAEGHTRIGILRGLVRRNIVPADSMHEVWIGS